MPGKQPAAAAILGITSNRLVHTPTILLPHSRHNLNFTAISACRGAHPDQRRGRFPFTSLFFSIVVPTYRPSFHFSASCSPSTTAENSIKHIAKMNPRTPLETIKEDALAFGPGNPPGTVPPKPKRKSRSKKKKTDIPPDASTAAPVAPAPGPTHESFVHMTIQASDNNPPEVFTYGWKDGWCKRTRTK